MSTEANESELNLDLAFLPAWAKQSPEINRYANFEGEREGRRDDWSRGPRRDRPSFGGPRPNRDRSPGDRPSGPRPPGGGQRDDRGPRSRDGQFGRGGPRDSRPPFERPPELPPIGVEINLVPEAHGVDSLTKQIRMTGRAYPLFDIARLVLQKDERFGVEIRVKKAGEGSAPQALFTCVLDETLWLSEEEAINYVLEKHFGTFYQIEKTATEAPKGTYTFVAQCGFSGVLLGPPNYHDYQNKLHKLHQERFGTMPFDRFKARVKIVRDEEVVKKWIDEQSFKTEYVVLNVPEPMRLDKWDDVREHFRAIHLPNIIKPVERQVGPATQFRRAGSRELQRHVAQEIDQQRRFPLKMVTTLSQQFATRSLQFFKVNKNIVHVAVARPHFLDIDAEPISEGVKKIVQYVNQHPRCTVKAMVESLAPVPAQPAPAPQIQPAPATDGQPATEAKPAHHEPTAAQKTVLGDLHWLVHSGHVIEFASGQLETAKKPLPKPQPAPKKKEAPKAPATAVSAAAPAAAPAANPPVAEALSSAAGIASALTSEAESVISEHEPLAVTDEPAPVEAVSAPEELKDPGQAS